MLSLTQALILVLAMGAVILFCRAFPFLFFGAESSASGEAASEKTARRRKAFLDFIEKTVPPAAMTVLALNAIGSSFLNNRQDGILVLAASAFTALLHLWKRNALISIIAGTALYMVLRRVFL